MSRFESLSPVVRRFLEYVQVDTQSDPNSGSSPSTKKQKVLGRRLAQELSEMGWSDVHMDEHGYVYLVIPGAAGVPALGLLAHMDTSPDEPGAAHPMVHFDYDGGIVQLPAGGSVKLDPSEDPELLDHLGEDLITSDGSTLLGSDDKAGVAILMQLAADLFREDGKRPELHICFTVDEEIGRGVDGLDLERFRANVAYTIDGGGTRSIYTETFNAAEATIEIEGVMVHPGYAKGIMVNALRILAQLIERLPSDAAPETTSGRGGYIHPHRIVESDPGRARANLILRDFTIEGLASRKELLALLVDSLRAEHPRARITLSISDQYRNMRTYIDEIDPRVRIFAHEAAKHLGYELEEKLVRGGTDGARLSELGIPTPNISNGGHHFHSRFEWNTAESIDESLEYVKSLVRYWGEHGANPSPQPL